METTTMGYIGIIQGLYWGYIIKGYIGIMENNMETTIVYWVYVGDYIGEYYGSC